jgi:hypothetical protein
LNGRDDVFQFAQVLLPDAAAAVVSLGPLRVIVIDLTLNLFGFQPLHRSLLVVVRGTIGDMESDFNLKNKGEIAKKVRG